MALGLFVTFNSPAVGTNPAGSYSAYILANNAGVLTLRVEYPSGIAKVFFNVTGASSPAVGQYDSDTFPTVQSS